MKKYKIKPTKKLLQSLKVYWDLYDQISGRYWQDLHILESKMRKETGIKDMEFFFCDGECAGIGNISRTMKLIPRN